jgi:two-component system, cell cycle sensor histidine kinase and response regulator CckA
VAVLDGLRDSIDVGVCVHDSNGIIIAANEPLHRILGLRPGELIGRDCTQIEIYDLDGNHLPHTEHPVLRAARRAQPVLSHLIGLHDSPRRVWVEMSALPRLDENGTVHEIIVAVADVSRTLEQHRHRHAELSHRVESSEQLYRAVIEAMSEGVVVHAPDGQIVAANHAATRILGLTLEQLTGRSPLDPRWGLVRSDGSPLPAEEIPSEITRVTGVSHQSAQLGVSRPDGEQRWLSVNTMPVGDLRSERHVVVTITDVTDARRMAEQMRNRQRLEAIGDLSAGVAHNFNNLLAVIMPSLELAMRDSDPISRNRTLGEALTAASAGADLVRQLLRVVRHDGREIREVIDCTKIVADVAAVCRKTFDRRIEIVVELPDVEAFARCRASDLQQVLLNLCLNARDAMATIEHPRLDLSIRINATLIDIMVTDNGHGMSEDLQRRLGDPFFTTKGHQHGTGLGIATAISALREVDGALTWTSRPDQGASFTVRLPVTTDRPTAAAARVRDQPELLVSRVLVVDDDDLVRSVLARMLEELGQCVTLASSGAEAIELIRADPTGFAAAFVDLSMPGLSGDRVLAHVREHAPSVRVIVMTGYLSTNLDLAGAAAVLHKPLGAGELEAVLARVLPAPFDQSNESPH